jgi:endonuclease/exonuclease/phosphatase family metal-dependent hydrolase
MSLSKLLKSVTVTDKTMSVTVDESKCLTFGSLKVSVMSFNVFYDLGSKLRNPDDVIVTVKNKNPDVFGLNEAGADWIAKFKKDKDISAKYNCAEGKPAENASDASYNPIFFDKAKLELVESDTKWLSKTPDRMSKDSDAKHYKILTYAILKDKASGTEFIYINAHLDGSNEADAQVALANVRKRQSEIVKNFAANYLFMPVIIGGDFNEQPSSGVIATITNGTRFKYCMTVADKKVDLGTTKKVTSNFTPCGNSILDYIFVTTDCINVDLYEQYDNKIDGKYSSDHLPVYTELTILY